MYREVMFLGLFELPLILLVGLLLLGLAGKHEPDPLRERPITLYLSVVTLIGVLMLFAATFFVANGLVHLTDSSPSFGNFSTSRSITITSSGESEGGFEEYRPSANHDDDISQVVGGVIIGALAAAVLWFHVPRLQRTADDSEGPGARVFARVLLFICGAALVTGLTAAGFAAYSVYGMIAPDTAGSGGTSDALRTFVPVVVLAAVAAYVFQRAWRRTEDLNAVARAATVLVETVPAPEPPPAPTRARRATKKAAPPTE
jgi:hypothetical protein